VHRGPGRPRKVADAAAPVSKKRRARRGSKAKADKQNNKQILHDISSLAH